MATLTDLSLYRGEDITITVTMSPPTNVSGWTFALSVKRRYEDSTTLISKTSPTIVNATSGIFRFSLASADTFNANVSTGDYVYDVQRTNSGSQTVLCAGSLKVLPQVAL